jgi:hypothetical protein
MARLERSAPTFAVTSSPAATPILSGPAKASCASGAPPTFRPLHCKSEAGDRMKRLCPTPLSTETQSSWERFGMAVLPRCADVSDDT